VVKAGLVATHLRGSLEFVDNFVQSLKDVRPAILLSRIVLSMKVQSTHLLLGVRMLSSTAFEKDTNANCRQTFGKRKQHRGNKVCINGH
jgi:hypothetical protein